MAELTEFTSSQARPLPVIILADVSGSMDDDAKIDILNQSIQEMVTVFAGEGGEWAEIHLGVIAFGAGMVKPIINLQPSSGIEFTPLTAGGDTPMGQAFEIVRLLLEDKSKVPSRAYRPLIVLVSDGIPTDEWENPLKELLASSRAAKADRIALAIGDDADLTVLEAFTQKSSQVIRTHQVREIRKFFRWITMSVSNRSKSSNPNDAQNQSFEDFNTDFDF
jgi:uncharacterized protein YegL